MLENTIKEAERSTCELIDQLKAVVSLNGPAETPQRRALDLHVRALLDDAHRIRDGLRRLWA